MLTGNGIGMDIHLFRLMVKLSVLLQISQLTLISRERYGDTHPEISEITVSKIETYYLMNEYLSKLTNTPIKTIEDIVRFNDENSGTEGGHAGDLPAWPDGQVSGCPPLLILATPDTGFAETFP